MFKLKSFFLFAFLLLLVGCAIVPITGRQQLSLVSQYQLIALSEDNYQKILRTSKLSKDRQKIEMVEEVGQRIASAASEFMRQNGRWHEVKDYRWEFKLIQDDENINAFCMPGGKIAVYTGILPYTQDEAGLAVVLAHEIAHAIANHGGERMSHLLLIQFGGATLSRALEEEPEKTRELSMLAYGIGANVSFLLPYSRIQEQEADHIGLILMAKAGYDPHAALDFWKRMNEPNKTRPPEFLSTHPAPEARIRYIQSQIPNALRYYKK